jgi:hypothetical protein
MEQMRKAEAMASLEVLSWHLPLATEETMRNLRLVSVLAEIGSECLPNTKHKSYRLS